MRVEYPGAIYHVMSSEILREQAEATGGRTFLLTMWIGTTSSRPSPRRLSGLAEGCQKTGWPRKLSGLVVETPTADLVAGMRWFLSAYTIRIICEAMSRLGWTESDLACRLKNDPGKLGLAARVRKETPLPIKWIAQRLQMGTAKSLKPMLLDLMHAQEKPARQPSRTRCSCEQLQFQPPV